MFDMTHLGRLRADELSIAVWWFGSKSKWVLDIGAGTGSQSLAMSQMGYMVDGIDLPDSNYAEHQVFPVRDYDGRNFPCGDRRYDVVFSSNVLEHVEDLAAFDAECHRVLRPGGRAVHIVPTPAWRVWTLLTGLPRPEWRHGAVGNPLTEPFLFRAERWRRHFNAHGWEIIADMPMGLFYTGNMVLGAKLSLERRRTLARWLGSACRIFVLREGR